MIENDQPDIEGKTISIDDITALVDALCETARKSNFSPDDFIKMDDVIANAGLTNPIFPDELRKVEKEND